MRTVAIVKFNNGRVWHVLAYNDGRLTHHTIHVTLERAEWCARALRGE